MAAWMPVTVVPTSLATVAMDTFMTELSRVIRNCPAARVSRTSPVPLAGASGTRVLTMAAWPRASAGYDYRCCLLVLLARAAWRDLLRLTRMDRGWPRVSHHRLRWTSLQAGEAPASWNLPLRPSA